jgi:O-antigen/teichoic acid export membrane protein
MNLLKAGLIFSSSTLSKLLAGLLTMKIIAITIGVDGLGRLGQFISLMYMVTTLAGGGVTGGIIKYVSEFKNDEKNLPRYLGAASLVTIIISTIVGFSLFVWAYQISLLLFKTDAYFSVIRVLAFVQALIALVNFLLGLVSGYQRVTIFAISSVISVMLGAAGIGAACFYFGMEGAMYGLMWMSACPLLFLLPWYKLGLKFKWRQIYPKWDREKVGQFAHYVLMLLTSVLTMQLSQIVVRHIIESHSSWVQVGYWQAVTKVSDAYLQFITIVLANYFLPRLAELKHKSEIKKEMLQAYRYAIPVLILMGIAVFILRDWIIVLLFSREFLPMKEFFTFQLIGDVFKIAAYIGTYLAVAKARTKIYIVAEIYQASMLILLCIIFVDQFDAVGVTYAYCLNYLIYFVLVGCVLRRFFNNDA